MLGVDQKLKQKEERALKCSEMQTAMKKRTYEEMEQNFDSRQFATSEMFLVMTVKVPLLFIRKHQHQQFQQQPQQQVLQLEVHSSFSRLFSLRFSIGAKSQIEIGFTY